MDRPEVLRSRVFVTYFGKSAIMTDFRYPDDTVREYLIFDGKTSAIIFALTEDEEVIAILQFRHGANDFVLELPGGSFENEETLEELVREELRQETGYQAEEIIQLGDPVWFDPACFKARFYPVLALGCKKVSEPEPEITETLETRLFSPQEWIEIIHSGKILDSKTMAVTFRALRQLKKRGLL